MNQGLVWSILPGEVFFMAQASFSENSCTPLCEGLSLVRASGVVFLVFHDVASRNAIGSGKAETLATLVRSNAFETLLASGAVGACALVSSVPGVFLSGGDIRELARASEAQEAGRALAERLTSHMRSVCSTLSCLPVPTFSLLAGSAYGGGAEVALATDFRMAACLPHETSTLALHLWQTKWAVPGGWHGMARLSALSPGLDARRVSLLFAAARSLGYSELVRWGLLDFLPLEPLAGPTSSEPDTTPVSFGEGEATFSLPGGVWSELAGFAQGFVQCPPRLRADFLQRNSFVSASDGDDAFFARHWMQDAHRERLAAFTARKSGNTP